jgi:hypothetical protein
MVISDFDGDVFKAKKLIEHAKDDSQAMALLRVSVFLA